MIDNLKFIRPGNPQYDLAHSIHQHILKANALYVGDGRSLTDTMDGIDDLVTAAVSMIYESLAEYTANACEEDEVMLNNSLAAITDAKRTLLANLKVNLLPEESYQGINPN